MHRTKHAEISAACDNDNRIFKLVSGLMFVLICMYVLVPLIELFTISETDEKPFPYKMVFPYDANSGIVYAMTYLFTSVAGFGVVATLFSEDSLFGFYVSHVCGQFKLLHVKIADMTHSIQMQNIQGRKKSDMHRTLKGIIVEHNIIIG